MQPYQEATREIGRQGGIPLDTAKKAGSLGVTAAGVYGVGGGLASKAMALLNKHVPEELAIKGLSKLNPGFGKLIQKALAAGKTFDETRNFLSEKVDQGIKEQHQPKESGNVIKQYSPELHQFIEGEIQKGRSPDEAGAMAQLKPEFKKHIEKLSKDHKAPFSALLKTVYGEGKKAESTRQYNARNQQKQTMMQQEQERFDQQYGQEQQQQGQGLDPDVAKILQASESILKSRGQ